jgi:hypothetical protein
MMLLLAALTTQVSGQGNPVDFRYSAVLLLPLVLVAGVAFVVRTLTTDATPTSPKDRHDRSLDD